LLKPAAEWDEAYAVGLPSETDEVEKKGSELLNVATNQDAVRDELAKQLSAFANMAGGHILYGVKNSGEVDNGGISRIAKGRQSTKEWLEDVIPILTEFEITGVRVQEILSEGDASAISPGKGLIVIEVPASERAPHQSARDYRYYVRLGGKSLPAPHQLVEDIRNRIRHPVVRISESKIINAVFQDSSPSNPNWECHLWITLRVMNQGTLRANNVCVALAGVPLKVLLGGGPIFRVRGESLTGTGLVELSNSIYPAMAVAFSVGLNLPARITPSATLEMGELTIGGMALSAAEIVLTTYADSAPPFITKFRLIDLDPERWLDRMVNTYLEQLRRNRGLSGR
jgi:hypothetical protein